jgi:hypothetical protein
MEAASIQINPMGTLNGAWLPMFRPTTNPACAPTRGAIATESCRPHRIGASLGKNRRDRGGVGAGTLYRHAACPEGPTTSADLAILLTTCNQIPNGGWKSQTSWEKRFSN